MLGQAKHINNTNDARFNRMYGVELVMDRRCWARKIVDFLDFDEQRLINIMPKKLKARMGQ